ncbi:hypothetical protein ARMSODRAFT_1002989 [Armillaria solidipes]|uniref:Uncharacterized protein n=1 Tax=Armillaria solidipes TaxID=1076256 RepID=A0A2H3BJS8_9AGAR|nr:hypothetical protein ARMSODRAFT_1002989 [Armillaria solidipes]
MHKKFAIGNTSIFPTFPSHYQDFERPTRISLPSSRLKTPLPRLRFNLSLLKSSNAWSPSRPDSSVILLIQQISDNEQFILKPNDRRLDYRHSLSMEDDELPWTPALEERLRAAVRDIQFGFNEPRPKLWEDWMWEISTWTSRMEEHQTEVDAYRLLCRLQGHLIPHFYGLVHLPISFSPSLHPITDYVPGIVIEYIQGVSMGSLQPGVDIPRPVAEAIADRVMDAFRTIKAEECDAQQHTHRQYSSARLGSITGPN